MSRTAILRRGPTPSEPPRGAGEWREALEAPESSTRRRPLAGTFEGSSSARIAASVCGSQLLGAIPVDAVGVDEIIRPN